MKFEISGEFGYELFAGLPLVNWYKEQGHDVEVISAKGSSLLYPNIKVTEKYNSRHTFFELVIDGKSYYRPHNHVAGVFSRPVVGDKLMWEDKWSPPDLKSHYLERFQIKKDKPFLVVSNKIQNEWGRGPVNYLSVDVLRQIFELCKDKFNIVYNRPSVDDIVNDDTLQESFGDRKLVREMNIPTMQNYAEEYDLDYNTTQMAVMSNCNHFISTQGGNSALSAYFGGRGIIYGVEGYEVKHYAYKTFFPKLSGQAIHHVQTYDDLISKVKCFILC